jgi:hypothetical protein
MQFTVWLEGHWKSAATGILIFIMTTTGVLSQAGMFTGKAAAAVALISALATAYIQLLKVDAGTALAADKTRVAMKGRSDAGTS